MSAAKSKRWRMTRRRDGEPVLRSPEGREYLATAAAVRELGMMPWRRRQLADALKVDWKCTKPRSEMRRELVAERRMWMIQETEIDRRFDATEPAYLPASLAIQAEAAARANGQDVDEFVAEWVRNGIDALRELNGGLTLTRHERAALERLEGERGVA